MNQGLFGVTILSLLQGPSKTIYNWKKVVFNRKNKQELSEMSRTQVFHDYA
jgi:hypothetical protein